LPKLHPPPIAKRIRTIARTSPASSVNPSLPGFHHTRPRMERSKYRSQHAENDRMVVASLTFEVGEGVVEIEAKQTRILTNDGGGDNVEDIVIGFLGNFISVVGK